MLMRRFWVLVSVWCVSCCVGLSDVPRRSLIGACAWSSMAPFSPAAALAASYQSGIEFEGGAGGLGKKKPVTGVVLSETIVERGNSKNLVQAQLLTSNEMPVDVSFESPFKRGSDGVSTRDPSSGDGAFVVVSPKTKDVEKAPEAIFALEGRYGAYGAPTDVRLVRRVEDTFEYEFDALTPSSRIVRRRLLVKTIPIDGDVFMLVAGAPETRWKSVLPVARDTIASFKASPAPDFDAAMARYNKKMMLR